MNKKILQVFYGADALPYKDKERTVHFPIVGNAIQNANNTTQIKFYFDRLVEENEQTTFVAVSKLPNGKIGSKILETYDDEELGEQYALLDLDSFYTQYKGDVFISLQGYQGGVRVEQDEQGIYQIYGTPVIAATGSIKLAINYAPSFVGSGETENITLQQVLGELSTKLGVRQQTLHVEELPTVGNPDVWYVINDDPNDAIKTNIYIWNATTQSYVWVGDNTLDLGDYYTTEQGQEFEEEIDQRITNVENTFNGSPKGVYATLTDLESAYPTGTNGIYVVSENGHWYFWNGTAWNDGGLYLSSGDTDYLLEEIDKYNDVFELNILELIGLGDGTYNGIAFAKNDGKVSAIGTATGNQDYYYSGTTPKLLKKGKYKLKLSNTGSNSMPIAILVGTTLGGSDIINDIVSGGDKVYDIELNVNTNVYFVVFFFNGYTYNLEFFLQLEKGNIIHGDLVYGQVYDVVEKTDELQEQINETNNRVDEYDDIFKLNLLKLIGLGDGDYSGLEFTKSTNSVSAVGSRSSSIGYQYGTMQLKAGTYTIKLYSNGTNVMPIALLIGSSGYDTNDIVNETVYGGDKEITFTLSNDTTIYVTAFFFQDYTYNLNFHIQLEKGAIIHGDLAYGELFNVIKEIDGIKLLDVGVGTNFPDLKIAFEYAIEKDLGVNIMPGTYDFSVYENGSYEGPTTPKYIKGYGAKIIANLTNPNWDFSPLNINRNEKDVTIEGLEIECTNCRYCIHDEMWGIDFFYHHTYKNLKLTHNSEDSEILLAPQCIGAGIGNSGRIDISRIVCSSEHANDVNYHGNVDGQTGNCEVHCTDSIFKSTIVCGSVRNYTNFMNVLYVSNCLCGVVPTTHQELNAKTISWNNVQGSVI